MSDNSKSNIDLGDEKLKAGEKAGQQAQQNLSVPMDAAGNYDPDHAAPGGYSVPPSMGPIADSALESMQPSKKHGKKDVKKDAPAQKAEDKKPEDDKLKPGDNKGPELHGDTGTPGLTPAAKTDSLKSSAAAKTVDEKQKGK